MHVTFADGIQKLETLLVTNVGVKLENRVIKTTFIVFPKSKNNRTLFGMDFIENARIVLDIPQRTWHFADETEKYNLALEESKASNEVVLNMITTLGAEEGTMLDNYQRKICDLLDANQDIFALGGAPTPFAEHRMDIGDNPPIAVPPYKLSPPKKEILRSELDRMLKDDIIEECELPWAAPVVLVPKKDGSARVCVDYRRLHSITTSDTYPMPRIDEVLHLAKRTLYMITIGLRSGYWQVSVKPSDRDKTPFGRFRFKRMPFGMKNSGATFQRLMDRFRSGLKEVTSFAYLDDLIILSSNFEEHLSDLNAVFHTQKVYVTCKSRKMCFRVCASSIPRTHTYLRWYLRRS